MKVVCISGHAQNGKDTSASFMKEYLEACEQRVLVCHYGDLVKYICKTFFGWDGVKDENGRSILQRVGTDEIRAKHPDYWVDFITGVLKMFPNDWDYVLIPDARFPNEIDAMKHEFDTVHVRVRRLDPKFVSPLTEEQQKHPSETALDNRKPDIYINNIGTLNELRKTVYDISSVILGEHQMNMREYDLIKKAEDYCFYEAEIKKYREP